MKITITKSARQFGYIIWKKKETELENLTKNIDKINVIFNGFQLGEKNIDHKYHRIFIGCKFTKSLPASHNTYSIEYHDNILEVKTLNAREH